MLFTLHFVRYSIILIIFNRGISGVGLLFPADVFPCGNLACSPATARTHARTCALLLWGSGHSLLLSFLRLFLWHQPARLFYSLFAHGRFSGTMKCRGLFPFARSTLVHYCMHKSRSYPKYVVLSRSLRSLLPDDGARSLRSLRLTITEKELQ